MNYFAAYDSEPLRTLPQKIARIKRAWELADGKGNIAELYCLSAHFWGRLLTELHRYIATLKNGECPLCRRVIGPDREHSPDCTFYFVGELTQWINDELDKT